MTRKDYVLIADAVRSTKPVSGPGLSAAELTGQQAQYEWTAGVLAGRLAVTNPRFDRQRFLTACGVQS